MLPTIKIHFERWKWNEQHEIWVSTDGRLKDRNKDIIEPMIGESGYVVFFDEQTQKFKNIHRIVLETWRPRSDMRELTVEHKDQNKRNPALRNLMWLTQEENMRRGLFHNLREKRGLAKGSADRRICANGVTMTVEDAVTFIFNGSHCNPNMSKIELRTKVQDLLASNKQTKSIYGVTFTEVKQ